MKICATSDTHGYRPNLPPCDLLVHAGDICADGGREDWLSQLDWLAQAPAKWIVLVPGNHDWITQVDPLWSAVEATKRGIRLLLGGWTKIEDTIVYGAPWCVPFHDWAHGVSDGSRSILWTLARSQNPPPDILVTHSPPYGRGDSVHGQNVGCFYIRETAELWQPKLHLFGHIHEGAGSDPFGRWHNVSHLDGGMVPTNNPLVLDYQEVRR